jgi:hypothetical protein
MNPRNRLWFWAAGVAAVVVVVAVVARPWLRHNAPAVASSPADAASPTDSTPQSLPEADREHIWAIEHQGLVLKKLGFGPLKKALQDADRSALLGLFADDFRGEELGDPRSIGLATDAVQARREEEVEGRARRPLDRAAFADRLLSYRRRFAAPPNIDVALMTLSPETTDEGDWKGEVQVRLWGEAAPQIRMSSVPLIASKSAAAPAEVVLNLQFRIQAPTEENLAHGGWLRSCAVRQSVVEDAPSFLFQDATARRGIDASLYYDNWKRGAKPLQTSTGGVYLADFDRDGCLDMLVVDINRITLYKGLPNGNFTDVTSSVGLPALPQRSLAAAFIDLDGDGWEDLILGGAVYHNVSDGNGGRRFEDVTYQCNWRLPDDALGIAVCDYDRDGHMDFYVTRAGKLKASSWVDGTGAGGGNRLWHNTGDGFLMEDVTDRSGTSGDARSTFSAVWLDADNDGWPDLYVINEFGNGVLLLNNHDGTFREKLLADGPADFGSMGVTCGDVDNDGNIDLFVNSMYSKAGARIMSNVPDGAYPPRLMAQMRRFVKGSQMWMNHGGAQFQPKAKDYQVAAVGWAYGAALVDVDNDGWLDLYATSGFVSEDHNTPDG